MKRILILLLALFLWNTSAWSQEYQYTADVKGMVCSFCAYSVGKNISKLPGVVKESVDVSLKNGTVRFQSGNRVTQEALEPLFIKSGFTISSLKEKALTTTANKQEKPAPVLELELPDADLNKFEPVMKAVADIAASTPSRIVIEAPQTLEMDILKPLLMGRQQVIKVDFIPVEQKSIHLQLFDVNEE